jgi:hypothetical protein
MASTTSPVSVGRPRFDDLSVLGELSKLGILEIGAPKRGRFATRRLRSIALLTALRSLTI